MKLTDIKASKEYLNFTWDDGVKSRIRLSDLRVLCPCALCAVEKEKQNEMSISRYKPDQLMLLDISVVGNYAINVLWKDGHNTGIYQYDYLREISEEVNE